MFGLHVYMCTMCVPCILGDQKRVLDPLTLELQVVVSHLGAGTDWINCNSTKCF